MTPAAGSESLLHGLPMLRSGLDPSALHRRLDLFTRTGPRLGVKSLHSDAKWISACKSNLVVFGVVV